MSILTRCYSCMDSWQIPPVCRRCCQSIKCPQGLMTYYHLPWILLMLECLPFYPQKLMVWLEYLFLSQATHIYWLNTLYLSTELSTENTRCTEHNQWVPALKSLHSSRAFLDLFLTANLPGTLHQGGFRDAGFRGLFRYNFSSSHQNPECRQSPHMPHKASTSNIKLIQISSTGDEITLHTKAPHLEMSYAYKGWSYVPLW